MRARAVRSRRIAAAVAVALSLLATTGSPTAVGLQSLALEWGRCAITGRSPQPQPLLAERVRVHSAARRPITHAAERPAALPIVNPRDVVQGVPPGRHPVVVAVLDSGVAGGNADLGGRLLPGRDLVNPCGDGQHDVLGHGTAVAGVIASSTTGAAPDVQILPVRITLATGRQHPWASALGIVWAARHGADVINMSYTKPGGRPSFLEGLAIAYAHRRGVAMVASAGNRADLPAGYPAAYPGVVSVTAVDGTGEFSSYAARHGVIDLSAPGSRILTISAEGEVITASGTSLAAPLVSALIARVLSVRPDLTPIEAADIVVRSASAGPGGIPGLDVRALFRAVCEEPHRCE